MKEISLEERKALQFDILVKIDAICREQGLRYYLNSGTLLGAVRHKGDIPWDDDIDIAMPRPDYEAFYQHFMKTNNDATMQLVSYRDKTSIYPFFKMIDPRTSVVEHYVDPKYRTGVWVDIFPLDGVKKGTDEAFKLNDSVKSKYDLIIANPNNATTPLRKAVKKVLTPIFRKQDIYAIAKQLNDALAATPICPENDVAMAMWGYGACERTPYSILETCELEFEGKMFYAPKEYDLYLTSLFGDYMTPRPPTSAKPISVLPTGKTSVTEQDQIKDGGKAESNAPKEKGLSIKLNMLWNSAGSLAYLGCQWLITVLVVHLSDGYDAAGTLSLAMSVYNMFSSLALYRMYTYQVSDVKHENSVGEYFAFRLITCGIALALILVYSLATCPLDAFATIALYAVYKIASLLIDVLHGLDQQNHRMDYIGKSLTMQGIASLAVFCFGMAATNNLNITIAAMAAAIVVIGLAYDMPRSARFERLHIGITRKKALHLLGYCLPIVIAAVACGAAPSIPRQYLAAFSGSAALGIYASVAAPVTIIQMGASYIYNPLLGYFSEAYANKDMKQLASLLLKAGLGIAALGIVSAVALQWLGEPLLVLIFGESIAPYTYLLTPIIAVAMVTAYVWFLNDVLVAIRDFKGSFAGNMVAAALSIPATFFFVPLFDMNGVSFAALLAYSVSALIMLLFLVLVFKRQENKRS